MSSDNSENNVIPFVSATQAGSGPAPDQATAAGAAHDTQNEICDLCFGTGTRLERDEEGRKGSIKKAVLCECRRTNIRDQLCKASRIPLLFRKCSFRSYDAVTPTQKWAVDYARRLSEEYPDVGKGLLLMGSVGVGKTHLAVAILNHLIQEKVVPCLFYESGSLLKAIQGSYDPVSETSEMRLLAPVYETKVLVLDELGASIPSSWVRDTLYQIINRRYMDNKLTIFTTNYFDKVPTTAEGQDSSDINDDKRSFSSRDPQKYKSLEERIGAPLRSRLLEMCQTLEIKGEDYRRRFQGGLSPADR